MQGSPGSTDDARMSDTEAAPTDGDEPKASRNETISVIILGIAATLTAIAAWLSGVSGGDEAEARESANAALTDANFFFNEASASRVEDGQLFIAWLEASQNGGETEFIENLMTPNLIESIDYWNTTEEAATPFDEDGPYEELFVPEGQQKQAEYEQHLVEADDAAAKGDKLDLSNVVFAVALFAAGIVAVFKRIQLQGVLLVVAALSTIFGIIVMVPAL